ncbi:zinc finger, CCHC-type containing protein [Tanacetum coccineum]|uniref:Zinc finger, CCHC-type containing protein n=1 Tax=Tanacetum coccineum TaxID=301880 RepID=A0ABQ5GNQ8_9ASTR
MKSYLDTLERLSYAMPNELGVSLILNSLKKDYDQFVQNYNMHSMRKTLAELHAMLKLHEKGILKKAETPAVLAIREGKIQKDKKKLQGAKGCGTQICNTSQGLRESRKLKHGALSLYMGNGIRAAVEAIKSFDLIIPSGLIIVLNNCHFAPTIIRGVVSISILVNNGYIHTFMNYGIFVSKVNVFYFNTILRDGIYRIDMHNLYPNVSSNYNVSNKRATHGLDSYYLWHCLLGHINKKHMDMLQHDGLLQPTHDESHEKYKSCISGKMARKPFLHQVERAKDMLGLIHTDVYGPFKIVSREGVFQNEVENQLGKKIKDIRSDRGGEYLSYGFVNHMKSYGIVSQLTSPYTPRHNRVSERKNHTLLDMVQSMMNLTTLPKSFWGYTLETAARILNMVPQQEVDRTPYEICYPKETMEASGSHRLLEISGSDKGLEIIQVEDTQPSENTSEEHNKVAPIKVEPQNIGVPIRRSTRIHQAPDRYGYYVDVKEYELGDLDEPPNYKAALVDPKSDKWLEAMNTKMQSMKDDQVWYLVDLPLQVTRDKRDEEFTEIENNKELADIQANNILSQGLPRHVFNILNQTSVHGKMRFGN